jgi:hypothetical protein
MTDKTNETDNAKKYSLVSVEKTSPPTGMDGDNWYRYVVARDNSTIVGNMRGTLKQVTREAREFVDNLNDRTGSPKARSVWSTSSKISTPAKS